MGGCKKPGGRCGFCTGTEASISCLDQAFTFCYVPQELLIVLSGLTKKKNHMESKTLPKLPLLLGENGNVPVELEVLFVCDVLLLWEQNLQPAE